MVDTLMFIYIFVGKCFIEDVIISWKYGCVNKKGVFELIMMEKDESDCVGIMSNDIILHLRLPRTQLILKIQFVTWWVRFIYSILLLFSFGNNNLDKYLLNHINQSYHTICLVEKEVMLWLHEKFRQIITKNLLKLVLELRSQICYILLVFILLIYA